MNQLYMGALGNNPNGIDNNSQQSTSQGGSGLNVKNGKNVLSGPLHSKIKPIGSSHME